MFVLAYPNGKNSVLTHWNQSYDLVRNATKFFFYVEMFVKMHMLEYKIETTILISFHKTGAVNVHTDVFIFT